MTIPYSSPPKRPAPVPAPSTNLVLQPDASGTSSPRRTSRYRRTRTGRSNTDPPVSARPSKRETFLDDVTPVDGVRGTDGGDEKDPHDLEFSSRHVTRASVVDNMLIALDQFSTSAPSTIASRQPPNASLRHHPFIGRRRGSTFSSYDSSDTESNADEIVPPQSLPRCQRSNSNSNFHSPRSLQPVPILDEEEEPNGHNRVTDRQGPSASTGQRYTGQKKNGRRSGRSSGSSSVDLGQAFSGYNLESAPRRRSQSFDIGSNRRRCPILRHDAEVSSTSRILANEMEAAPTPIVPAGPSRGHSPVRHNPTIPLASRHEPLLSSRRNSAKSSRTQFVRKGRARTMGNVRPQGRNELCDLHDNLESLPPMPTYCPPPPQSPTLASRNPSQGSSADLLPPGKDRPGFFKRVFGSKSINAPNLQAMESEHGVPRDSVTGSLPEESCRALTSLARPDKHTPKDLHPTTTNVPKEQQTITKKSSAFFRRRKKSVSEQMPRPLPLTLQSTKVVASEPSPVSSLRQIMDPYLTGPPLPSPKFEPGSVSPQGFHTAPTSFCHPNDASPGIDDKTRDFTSQFEPTASKLWTPVSQHTSNSRFLAQDHQDSTFLADSSGNDEPTARSVEDTSCRSSDGRSRSSPAITYHGQVSEGSLPTRLLLASASSSDVATPSSGSKPPHSPSSPNLPNPALASKTARPSNLRLQREALNKVSRRGSSSKDQAAGAVIDVPLWSGSDSSVYKSAPTTPMASHQEVGDDDTVQSPAIHVTASPDQIRFPPNWQDDREQALKIFENRDENLDPGEVSAWLGDAGDERDRVRVAYMSLFDWTKVDILSALRGLCARIALKGETQQVDRMLDAFSRRWCECNCNHGFKSCDVVHTICYSILLLNTDLHLADIGQKMTRAQFIRNTLPTIRRVASDSALEGTSTIRAGTWPKPDAHMGDNHPPLARSPTIAVELQPGRSSIEEAIPIIGSHRPAEKLMRENSYEGDGSSNDPGPLVTTPFVGSIRAWECQIEAVLKRIYSSIARERLPLFGAKAETLEAPLVSNGLLSISGNMLRRSPSTMSKAASEHSRGRAADHRLGTGRWVPKARSRPPLHAVSTVGSTRTSMDEASSAWSPSISSTWSKASLGKTLTSMSVDSLGSEGLHGNYQKSIGFANALSQAIIREDTSGTFSNTDGGMKAAPLLDDDSLELSGAPWAKEGSLKHKHHLDGVDKRARDRNWNDCFAVIEKGWLRLFSFSVNAKSLRIKAKDRAKAGGVVGGGNWMENAEEVWKLLLRHSLASALPDPGYSKARPYVWALSLPTGAVHLFQVGTPEIVKEFVSTANYWSARLSKEPMTGGISNIEYGWSDAAINHALISSDSKANISSGGSSRPSVQSSLRSSFEQVGGSGRAKLPGDKIIISDWSPPQQSMMASQLMEVDQLRTLQAYVRNVEEELSKHNELRPAMQLAFSARHPNTSKAMANWEKKSSYLLREIVKFKTYVDTLVLAQKEKDRVLRMKAEGYE